MQNGGLWLLTHSCCCCCHSYGSWLLLLLLSCGGLLGQAGLHAGGVGDARRLARHLVRDLDGLAALLREDLCELVDVFERVGAGAQLEPAGGPLLLHLLQQKSRS